MMRAMAIAGLLLAALSSTVTAGPYGEGSGANRCAGLLGSNVYRCAVKNEGGGGSNDCYRITAGQAAGKFALSSDLLGASVGCSCQPGGSSAAPDFDASASFTCVSDLAVSFSGRVNKDGSIARGAVTNAQGGTFAFSCVVDANCSVQ